MLALFALLTAACDLAGAASELAAADADAGQEAVSAPGANDGGDGGTAATTKPKADTKKATTTKATTTAAGTGDRVPTRNASTGSGTPNYDDPWAVPGPMVFFECDNTHRSGDDPIVFPKQRGATHRHVFFGNDTTDAMSTTTSLMAGDSSCDDRRQTSAYWFPEPRLDNGKAAENWDRTRAYYMLGDLDRVQPMPKGLRMLAGDMAPGLHPGETGFVCRPVHSPGTNGMPRGGRGSTDCPPGTNLGFSVVFPNCWDGRNLDSADHKSHVRYSKDGRCPTNWVPIPQLRISVSTFNENWNGRFSSGGPGSLHADFIASAQAGLMRDIVTCLNGGRCPADTIR